MFTIVGIDVGLKGALCLLQFTKPEYEWKDLCLVQFIKMPLRKDGDFDDIGALKTIQNFGSAIVFVERPMIIPGRSSGILTSGTNFGKLLGMMLASKINYHEVAVCTWQKQLHFLSKEKEPNPKERSLASFKQFLKLGNDLISSDLAAVLEHKSKEVREAFVDAFCIAEFGRECISRAGRVRPIRYVN